MKPTDDFEIKVVRTPRKESENGFMRAIEGVMRAIEALEDKTRKAFMRPWVAGLTSVTAFIVIIGTPHIGWEYRCHHGFTASNPCRSYASCSYFGIQGRRDVIPPGGEPCSLFTMMRPDWARLVGRG